jgi:hypothetical protein
MTRIVRAHGRVERAGVPIGEVFAILTIIDAYAGEAGEWRGTLTGGLDWDDLRLGEELTLLLDGHGAGRFVVGEPVLKDIGVYIHGAGDAPA